MITLAKNTVTKKHIDKLCSWLKKNPKLTKGDLTNKLEYQWSAKNDFDYSVYVNSGSSANLLMFYAASLYQEKKKSKNVIVPAVSWATTVAPVLQFGYNPIFCDSALEQGLAINPAHFYKLVKKYKPWAAIVVNPLGFIGDMDKIKSICQEREVLLLEDSCETVGSTYKGIKAGNFGIMSSFSFYFGHHFSTIEGGMVCTNNKTLYNSVLMLRSHGWDRDLDENYKTKLRDAYNIKKFKSLYSFYVPGFNLRATELQAFIGLEQLKEYRNVSKKRLNNYELYNKYLKKTEYEIKPLPDNKVVSNFAYPLISKNINKIVDALIKNNIETRPLICGSMTKQPMLEKFTIEKTECPVAEDIVDKYGLYLPNHIYLKETEIKKICSIVNKEL